MDTVRGRDMNGGVSHLFRCLITAGPTREHLDPVRFLSNGSSGKMGYALARAAAERKWQVDLVSGPVALPPPDGVTVHPVVSAGEMFETCESIFAQCDLFIAAAAVADFRPKYVAREKLKKGRQELRLELVQTIDILQTLASRKRPNQVVVGFAAETHDLELNARCKLEDKDLDWIVANDVGSSGLGMNSDDNAVLLLARSGERFAFGPAAKIAVAGFILGKIVPAHEM
jgi:phosphopantothenoylcysteine decarboxylase/phosphopantothenate--cysteine ligase